MARFYGEIGYGENVEVRPGVHELVVTVRKYYGDVLRNARGLETGDKVNNDLSVSNSISVLADPYANKHFHSMLFVEWAGTRWIISDVEVKSPRLILRLGGVYNGDPS